MAPNSRHTVPQHIRRMARLLCFGATDIYSALCAYIGWCENYDTSVGSGAASKKRDLFLFSHRMKCLHTHVTNSSLSNDWKRSTQSIFSVQTSDRLGWIPAREKNEHMFIGYNEHKSKFDSLLWAVISCLRAVRTLCIIITLAVSMLLLFAVIYFRFLSHRSYLSPMRLHWGAQRKSKKKKHQLNKVTLRSIAECGWCAAAEHMVSDLNFRINVRSCVCVFPFDASDEIKIRWKQKQQKKKQDGKKETHSESFHLWGLQCGYEKHYYYCFKILWPPLKLNWW